MMRSFGRKKGINYIPGNNSNSVYMSESGIRDTLAKFEKLGKDKCLDIGSGNIADGKYTRLDFRKSFDVDYYGDIRYCFAPDLKEKIDKYPDLEKIKPGSFSLVRVSHLIEHIEWIHQELLFEWLDSLLVEGGLVFISTPNFDYVVKMYLQAMQKTVKVKDYNNDNLTETVLPNFPFGDHDYTKGGRIIDIIKWANSYLFAGCSYNWDNNEIRGDYHHCSYNKVWLVDMLSRYFQDVHIYDGKILEAVAQKPFTVSRGVDSLIERSFNE